MIFTASKDWDKVNQILPVLKEHFGNSINLARIKFMSLLLHALVIAQTVSLHKLASFMPTEVGRDSNMRRIQRFLSGYILDLDLIARMIFSLLPVKENLVLSMDRTNWKFGSFNINILMLGITYRNVAFPILIRLMPKRGNSKWTERKELVERFIRLFGKDCIDCLVADREFIGKEWVNWLNSIRLRYYLRVRKNFKVAKGNSKNEIKVIHLICHLKVGEYACSSCRYNHKGNMVYIVGAHFRASNGVDYQILICFDHPEEGIETYRKRWQIETLFKGLKSSGFDIEKTHLNDTQRIERLLALVCIAFT